MQYLVEMKLAAHSRPKTPQEGATSLRIQRWSQEFRLESAGQLPNCCRSGDLDSSEPCGDLVRPEGRPGLTYLIGARSIRVRVGASDLAIRVPKAKTRRSRAN